MSTGIRKMRSFALEKHRHHHEEEESPSQSPSPPSSLLIRQCKTLADVKRLHALISFADDPYIPNRLVQLYGQFGSIQDAIATFSSITNKNIFSWNLAMAACIRNGQATQTLELLWHLDCDALVRPNQVTFLTIIRACHLLRHSPAIAQQIHARCSAQLAVINALITLHSRWGRLSDATALFQNLGRKRDVISWTALITAYAQNGQPSLALQLFFTSMDCSPDCTTFVSALGACSTLGHPQGLCQGRRIFSQIQRQHQIDLRLKSSVVLCNSLINMFGKCGSIVESESIFFGMAAGDRTVVTWNTLILAYSHAQQHHKALAAYQSMDVAKNAVTFVNALSACDTAGAAQRVQEDAARMQLQSDTLVGTALIHTFARLGATARAADAFAAIKVKNLVAWNALVAAADSDAAAAAAAAAMHLEGVCVNGVTFLSLLNACSHKGSWERSWCYLRDLVSDYGGAACAEHYGCMVDILGRLGELEEAQELITTMPFHEDAVAWMSLLCACGVQGDLQRAIDAAERVTLLEGGNACAPYSLLLNSFAYQAD